MLGVGQDINESFGSLPDFVDSGQRLLATLRLPVARAARRWSSNTGQFFDAISRRQGELSGLITAADNLFQTTAQRNQDLADVFKALPGFERQSQLTLPALTRFAQAGRSGRARARADRHRADAQRSPPGRLAPQFRALFERLGPTVTASKRGLPALDRILGQIPPLLGAFEPFLRNADPMVRYIGAYRREITGFFGNVTAASQAHDVQLPRTPERGALPAHLADADAGGAGVLQPGPGDEPRRCLPGSGLVLRARDAGLPVLNSAECTDGNPAPPTTAIPSTLAPLVTQYAFRTTGRDVAAPRCVAQGPIPGFSTDFPQLRADPPPSVSGTR